MKALTVPQQHASLIADGEKWVVNRQWSWLPSYRGPLAIHAGKGTQYLDCGELRAYPTSCVVAVAVLETAIHMAIVNACGQHSVVPMQWLSDGLSAERFAAFLEHEHTEGPVCLVLGNIRKLSEPVSCKGARGLWNVAEHLEEMITEHLDG